MPEDILSPEEKKAEALKFYGKTPDSTPTKTQEELDAEKKLADDNAAIEAKKKEDELAAAEEEKNKPKVEKVELTDAELLELASQRSGRKISSWDDLKLSPTEDDKKKAEEARDSDKLSFGLKKGLFNRNQYESFIADSKNPKDLVYGRELAEAKKDDPDWDAEKEKEFKEEFETKFGLNLDESSSKFKRGQKQILMIADNILKKEYSPIFSLDSAYTQYENEINSQKSQQQKILQEAPIYKENVEKVIAGLSKVEIAFGDEKYEVAPSKEAIDSLTEVLLENNFSSSHILKGNKKEELEETARTYLIAQNFQQLAFEAAKQYRQKHEKGVRGIPEGGKLEKTEEPVLTDDQKKAINFYKPAQIAN